MNTIERFCWICGRSMGFLADKYWLPRDTCGMRECERAARDADRQEREESHEQLDRDMGWL